MADLLAIEKLSAGYGEAVVLGRRPLSLAEGQSLALLGRNGMGKTTLINSHRRRDALSRRHDPARRRATSRALRPDQRAHAGIGWVPQERNIFKSLTVEENLTAVARPGPWTPRAVFAMFPRLAERRRNLGNQLSGGEQQMLAVGRALILNPRICCSTSRSKASRRSSSRSCWRRCARIIREEGCRRSWSSRTRKKILGVTDRAIMLDRGRIVLRRDSAALATDAAVLEKYLGVTHSDKATRRGKH